jgi:hypothetical protein
MTNLTALHNNLFGLVMLVVPAAMLLPARPAPPSSPAPARAYAAVALLLAAPSIGIMLVAADPFFYVASGWICVVGCLVVGVAVARRSRPGRSVPGAPRP